MPGVQLATASALTGGKVVFATVPADESWLVYTFCVASTDGATWIGGFTVIALGVTPSASGTDVALLNTQIDLSSSTWVGGPFVTPALVLNAGDELWVDNPSATGTVDVFVSGLIQRGPGIVPS